ncbi:MAG: ATP-binding protein [Clostridia bacterium]|jgi:predicted AAA+ superfamily ATPase|nr:ATP-binding protein [Clostridia bacterium]
MIARDSYLSQLIDYMGDRQIKVITGIRRCGKSVLLFQLFYDYLIASGVHADHILQIKLDKRKDAKYRNPIVLSDFISKQVKEERGKYYLFIDEVQMAYAVPDPDNPGHEITVYDMLNELKDYPNLDVYVTGSNSKNLSRDIVTQFRGRASQVHVYPLSFSEYHQAVGGDKRDNFDQYLIYGGMPYMLNLKTIRQRQDYLISLFQEVYVNDIIERHHIERRDVLEDMLDFLGSSISSLTNPTNIANTLNSVKHAGVSENTVSSYLEYTIDAFLISKARRYDIKGKSYFDYPNKYYFTDVGLRNARLSFRQIDPGHMMENVIYMELLRRGYAVDVGVVTDRRNGQNKQKEVDFVVNSGDKRMYIQSAWQIPAEKKEITEADSLRLTNDFFKRIIIRSDIPGSITDKDGIIHCNIIDFLLRDDLITP